ncbi:hypothetical protein TNCV_4423611 [Trichonephila clavipes]|nr:hypothetical protein TNCV_4423611 [Trichonephila clavipes]
MRRYPRAENRVCSEKEDHEERGSKVRASNTCELHSNAFNDKSRRRRRNCSTNNFQTPCGNWQKVVFSDESRFVLWTDDNRVRVWRSPGCFQMLYRNLERNLPLQPFPTSVYRVVQGEAYFRYMNKECGYYVQMIIYDVQSLRTGFLTNERQTCT